MMKIGKTPSPQFAEGIISTTGKGLGFVSLGEDSPREDDIRIDAGSLNTALHKDRVKVLLHPQDSSSQKKGEVVAVLERAKMTFVGTLENDNGIYYLVPQDNHIYVDVLVSSKNIPENSHGKKALVRITKWDDPKKNPEGELLEIIGKAGENETEIRAIMLDKGLGLELPPEIEREAKEIKANAPALLTEEVKKRRDFRNITTFTIDPADAKDFDDALSVQELPSGDIEIGVHIADVSAYIHPHMAIDEEARARATSVYLVDRVIPMFPEILSNDLCSLNEDEDKLTFSAVFTFPKESLIDPQKKAFPTSEWFGRTVIHSHKRFTYEEAQNIIDSKDGIFEHELFILNTIAKKLEEQNIADGKIPFEQDEVKFVLDENKKPISVYRKHVQDTNKLVEEFMLLANKKVAEFVAKELEKDKAEGLFVYRIHDKPDPERLTTLANYLKRLGYRLPVVDGHISSQDINKFLSQIKGRAEESMVQTSIIRTMAKAIYSTDNIGHYGLSFKFYTHFTSPIRRYPDVMVHRILAHYLESKKISPQELDEYRRLSAHSSEMAKLATDAERASIKYKQAEYMSTRIGQEFNGTISGVAEFGIFVEEQETKCEGIIRLSDIGNDYFIFEKENYRIIGKNTRKSYSLGDTIRVRVKSVNLEAKSIDYELIKDPSKK